eukprot:TRINITY_DN24392_c0_g1_i5.p1 TRINITY_DN24392_c0_g1~~TRINITY_DN24392_c0_g1_i5.p1  ORF type:complete len:149 (+),score=36.70 TRINITY_DN24392_c0_g1_i5:130-576(+)
MAAQPCTAQQKAATPKFALFFSATVASEPQACKTLKAAQPCTPQRAMAKQVSARYWCITLVAYQKISSTTTARSLQRLHAAQLSAFSDVVLELPRSLAAALPLAQEGCQANTTERMSRLQRTTRQPAHRQLQHSAASYSNAAWRSKVH